MWKFIILECNKIKIRAMIGIKTGSTNHMYFVPILWKIKMAKRSNTGERYFAVCIYDLHNFWLKVIDWTGACAQTIIARRFKRNLKDRTHYQPLTSHILKMETPSSLRYLPANNVTTRFVRTATNKQKCPVYQVCFWAQSKKSLWYFTFKS